MKKRILQVLKSIPNKIQVSSLQVDSLLTFYRLVFVDEYKNYYCLELFYNETDIFSSNLKPIVHIGNSNESNFTATVMNSLTKYSCYEDCKDKIEKKIYKFQLDKFLSSFSEQLINSILMFRDSSVEITDVKVFMNPSLFVCIYYNLYGEPQDSLKFFIGSKNCEVYNEVGTNKLIRYINEIVGGVN